MSGVSGIYHSLLNAFRGAGYSFERAQSQFQALPEAIRYKIFGQVYSLAGSPQNVESNWGENHIYDSLYRLKDAIKAIAFEAFDALQKEQKNFVAGRIYLLYGSPKTEDLHWGETHAKDNVEVLLCTMDQISEPKPLFFVDATRTIKSRDGSGEREHFSVSVVPKKGERVEVTEWPIDTSKYGEFKQIVVYDGKEPAILSNDSPQIKRLVDYFTTHFEKLRKEMNKEKLDYNGSYPNKGFPFDCQRFSFYLKHGKEGEYSVLFDMPMKKEYRTASHYPGMCYSITAKTENFGKESKYSRKDLVTHHFMCLTPGVYVSKYGESGVLFTSYQQILDAYFPKEFIEGYATAEF